LYWSLTVRASVDRYNPSHESARCRSLASSSLSQTRTLALILTRRLYCWRLWTALAALQPPRRRLAASTEGQASPARPSGCRPGAAAFQWGLQIGCSPLSHASLSYIPTDSPAELEGVIENRGAGSGRTSDSEFKLRRPGSTATD
jgi:hypothetical protein